MAPQITLLLLALLSAAFGRLADSHDFVYAIEALNPEFFVHSKRTAMNDRPLLFPPKKYPHTVIDERPNLEFGNVETVDGIVRIPVKDAQGKPTGKFHLLPENKAGSAVTDLTALPVFRKRIMLYWNPPKYNNKTQEITGYYMYIKDPVTKRSRPGESVDVKEDGREPLSHFTYIIPSRDVPSYTFGIQAIFRNRSSGERYVGKAAETGTVDFAEQKYDESVLINEMITALHVASITASSIKVKWEMLKYVNEWMDLKETTIMYRTQSPVHSREDETWKFITVPPGKNEVTISGLQPNAQYRVGAFTALYVYDVHKTFYVAYDVEVIYTVTTQTTQTSSEPMESLLTHMDGNVTANGTYFGRVAPDGRKHYRTDLAWIVAIIVVALLLCLLIAVGCFVMHFRGAKYPVQERERAQGREPIMEQQGFSEFNTPTDDSKSFATYVLPDTSRSTDYGDGDSMKFAETASFIGEYATPTRTPDLRFANGSKHSLVS